MKTKILILATALLFSLNIKAQGMPVYDNTNFISLIKQLLESGKQTSNLMKTVNFLKAQKENLEKVNDVIKQLKAVQEINRDNQKLIDIVNTDLREILNSPFIKPDEIGRISDSFNSIIDLIFAATNNIIIQNCLQLIFQNGNIFKIINPNHGKI